MVTSRSVLRPMVAVGVTFSAIVLGACSDVEEAVNRGGDTSCSDYLEQSTDDQRVTVTKFLKEDSGDDQEPDGTTVDAAIIAVDLLCAAQQNADTPIKDADLGGATPN